MKNIKIILFLISSLFLIPFISGRTCCDGVTNTTKCISNCDGNCLNETLCVIVTGVEENNTSYNDFKGKIYSFFEGLDSYIEKGYYKWQESYLFKGLSIILFFIFVFAIIIWWKKDDWQ